MLRLFGSNGLRYSSRCTRSFVYQSQRSYSNGVNPTSEYIPPTYDRPRYSLKRFNMQLAQSVFCRSPNLDRTTTVHRVMKYDGVKGDNITYHILFNAILYHEIFEVVSILVFFWIFFFNFYDIFS